MKLSMVLFLIFLMQCHKDDALFDETLVDDPSLVGEWLLTESYVSPGGAAEWMVVEEGYRYFFDEYGGYKRTNFNRELQDMGEYAIKDDELYLYFLTAGEKDTLGFSTDFNESKTKLTLSPTYPGICIEGCLYRFKKE